MKLHRLLLATLCWLPLAAAAQQSSPPAANPPAEVQPQAWPPAGAGTVANAPAATAPAGATPAAMPPRPPDGQIRLDVEVTDKAGKPVAGLDRSDFTLLDNNHPAAIQTFEAYGGTATQSSAAAASQPTQIILVIDTVNVGFDQVSYSRFGIDQFLRSEGGRLSAPTAIYWYTDTGLIGLEGATAPSTDGNALAAQLDATSGRLRTINRSSGAWGAIERFEMSLQTVNNVVREEAGQPGRKLLIWIGAGWPMLDNPNMQMTWKDQQRLFGEIVEMSTSLRDAQMQIYSVSPGMPDSFTYLYESYTKGVKKASQAYLPNLSLKVLAVQSGGFALSPSNDLAAEIEKCAREADAYYTISFTPPRADGPNEYHELKVRVDKPGLTARTATGYYNQPPGMEKPR